MTRNIWICLAVALLVLAVDQGAKASVLEGLRLQEGQSHPLSPVFAVTLLEGLILSIILMLIAFFSIIFLQGRDRRKHFKSGSTDLI